jgi:hypothetical protein
MLRDCSDIFKLIEACMGEAREKMRDVEPLHARIAELEAALKPFADANQFIILFGVQWVKATEDDFRAARAALKGEKR